MSTIDAEYTLVSVWCFLATEQNQHYKAPVRECIQIR